MGQAVAGNPAACDSCGKQFAWKPTLAGKSLPCKCGGTIRFDGGDLGGAGKAPRGVAGRGADRKAADPHKQAEVKKIIFTVIGLAVLGGAIVGANFAYKTLGRDDTKDMKGEDGVVTRLIRDDGATEIREWLAGSNQRGIIAYAWQRNRLEGKVKEWYDNGAKKVIAFGAYMTASVAIELPDEKSKRKFFFDYAEEFRGRDGSFADPVQKDVGQKYVLLRFTPASGK